MFAVYFLLLVLPLVSAQVEIHGRCPDIPVQPDLNLHAFLGKWYEIAKIPVAFIRGTCLTADYKMGKGNFLTVKNTQVINGKRVSREGTVRFKQYGEKAKLEIKFPESQIFRPHWVLNTDYVKYATLYSCEENGDTHLQFAWILSRQPTLDPKILRNAKRLLRNKRIKTNLMEVMDQSCHTKPPKI